MEEIVKNAYFAGLIDGEGHIGFSSSGMTLQPIIQVKMTCLRTIQALADHFGCGSVQIMKPGKAHHKVQYKWRVRCCEAIPVIECIRPYLITKAEAADTVLLAKPTKRGNRIAPDFLHERMAAKRLSLKQRSNSPR